MRNFKNSRLSFLLLCSICFLSFTSCKEEGETESELNFDQEAMLTNIGQNIIFPNYAAFNAKASLLQAAVSDFTQTPAEETLVSAQNALKEAYLAWQSVGIYEFGPAADLALRQNVNEFPTRYTSIEDKITAGSWDLSSFTSAETKGLPALDYLLFSDETNATILTKFTTAENAENRRRYLQDLANDLRLLATEVYNEWDPEQGNYLGTFNTTTGNSANSSLSLLVNNLNSGYEIIKNKKLNIPLGNRSIDEQPIPKAVEAYYSGISLDLMKANILSMENTFKGFANGTDGMGLDDNIDVHYEAGNIQNDLTDQILGQLAKAKEAVNALPEPLSEAVVIAGEDGDEAYNELQSLVVYLKNDMPQALSVLISYVDNDGD